MKLDEAMAQYTDHTSEEVWDHFGPNTLRRPRRSAFRR